MASLEETIRDLCHQMDRAIRQREARRVEDYLATLDIQGIDTDLILELIYTEFVARSEMGESPQVEEYYGRFPHLKEDLQELFFVHDLVAASLRFPDPASDDDRENETLPPETVTEATNAVVNPGESEQVLVASGTRFGQEPTGVTSGNGGKSLGTILGHYELLEEIGRGATAVVFKARDLRLKRYVALKVIQQTSWDQAARERTLAEAQAAASLRHPQIVQIYEVGETGEACFVAMEYLEGGSLADRPDRVWSPREAARLVERIARALQYAHEHQVLHRDLKPANVLLDLDGSPKIADFGLAKRLDEISPQGSQDDFFGTPSYMAPEQTMGGGNVGPATDVYGLGAILYELLTGRPPFTGKNAIEILLQVRNQDPISPSRVQPYIHRDLVTICMKCLEKAPERRYASAGALADDLQRFLEGHVILARPAGPIERMVKWTRRHFNAVMMGITIVCAVLSIILGLRWHFARMERIEQDRETLAQLAEQQAEALRSQQDISRQQQYVESLTRAQELLGENSAQALAILDDPEKCPEDLRDFAWHLLRRLCNEGRNYWTIAANQERWVRRLSRSPDGQYIFWGTWDGVILVWNIDEERVIETVPAHRDWVSALAVTPKNDLLASASYDHTIRVWHWQPQDEDSPLRLAQEFNLEGNDVAWDLAIHPDGKVLLAATNRGIGVFSLAPEVTVQSLMAKVDGEIMDPPTPRNVTKPPALESLDRFFFLPPLPTSGEKKTLISLRGPHRFGQAGMFRAVKFSPQGKVVACGAVNGRIVLFSWPQLEILFQFREFQDPVLSIDFSPDGNLVAAAAAGNVWLYNTISKQTRYLRDIHFHAIRTVQFSQDGRRLLTTAEDYTAKVWDVKSLAQSHRLTAHAGYAVYGVFGQDGRTVYTACQGVLNAWDLEKHDVPLRLGSDNRTTRAMAWSPDGKYLATIEGTLWRDTAISLWDVQTRSRLISAKQNSLSDEWLYFTRDGKWLVSVVRERTVQIREAQTLSAPRVVATLTAPLTAMTLSPDGQVLLGADRRGRLLRWDTTTWMETEIKKLGLQNNYAVILVFSPEGQRLLVGTADGRLILFDLAQHQQLATADLEGGPVATATFDPGGRRLAVVSRVTPAIQIFDLPSLKQTAVWTETPGFVAHLAFSPDGQALLSATPAELAAGRVEVRIWNVASGRCHAVFPELAGPIVFAPDGQSFLSLDRTRQVRIWYISSPTSPDLLSHHGSYNN